MHSGWLRIQVPSSVLAHHSPVLRQMLQREWKETKERVIPLKKLEKAPFLELGKYLTEGKRPQLQQLDDILDLYHTAHGLYFFLSLSLL